MRPHAPFAFNGRLRSRKDRIAITDVVAIVYCERQAVLDRQFGRRRSADVERTAIDGQRRHKSFEYEGRRQQDRRCFVATAIYGADAPETVLLRRWRDERLSGNVPGRAVMAAYYALSPALVRWFEHRPAVIRTVRCILDRLCRFLQAVTLRNRT